MWEEEDNIAIGSNINCVVYVDMPRISFTKKKDNASEAEVTSEISSELSSDERR